MNFWKTYIFYLSFCLWSIGEGSGHLVVVPIFGFSHSLSVFVKVSIATLHVPWWRGIICKSWHSNIIFILLILFIPLRWRFALLWLFGRFWRCFFRVINFIELFDNVMNLSLIQQRSLFKVSFGFACQFFWCDDSIHFIFYELIQCWFGGQRFEILLKLCVFERVS